MLVLTLLLLNILTSCNMLYFVHISYETMLDNVM